MSFASPVFKTLDYASLGVKPRLFSYSKLCTFCECNQSYYWQYVRKLRIVDETVYTIIGGLCHSAIEDHYEGGQQHDPYDCLLTRWKKELKALDMTGWFEALQLLADDIEDLEYRCTAEYIWDGDPKRRPIRDAKGNVYKNASMSNAYKDAAKALNLESRRISIDGEAAKKSARWKNFSIVEVFAATSAMMRAYQHPAIIKTVRWIEFPLSDPQVWAADATGNPLLDKDGRNVLVSRRAEVPKWRNPETGELHIETIVNPVFLSNGDLFNGYIDLVGTTADDTWALDDHKTSKGKPTPWKVRRHEQLNLYARAWHQLTEEWPTHLLISHLKSGDAISAQVDREFAEACADRLVRIIEAIDKEAFFEVDPYAFGSSCFDYRSGEPKCSFFAHCQPAEWSEIQAANEPVDLFA